MASTQSIYRALSENSITSNQEEVLSGTQADASRESAVGNMDFFVHDPIRSAFLLKFCMAHYCSESMRFVVEIDRFRDLFHAEKITRPRKNWRQLDQEHNTTTPEVDDFDIERDFLVPLREDKFFDASNWNFHKVPFASVKEHVGSIWKEFLIDNAPFWICIPLRIIINTVKRLKLIHVYGQEVFSEALIDPIKTIQRDIQPRFLASEEYRRMQQLVTSLNPLPGSSTLKLQKPPHVIYSRYDLQQIESGEVKFTLDDLINDRILFTEFMRFLEVRVSAENLRCIRTIQMFEEAYNSTDARVRAQCTELAWTIYLFFVAPGSAYGISVSHRRLKEVMRSLANPSPATFDAVRRSALSALRVHYEAYCYTKEYAQLYKVVLLHKDSGILAALENNTAQRELSTGAAGGSRKVTPSFSAIMRNTCFPNG